MARSYVFSVPVGPGHTSRLRQTLTSLSAQTVPIKVALCDASGAPECTALADEFSDIIAYRRHGPDKGQSHAINEGWQAIEGDVYSWLNADDHLAPDALAKVDALFDTHTEASIVYGQSQILEDANTIIGLHPAVTADIALLTRSNIISQPSCFYKKAALDKVGPLNPALEYVMDWDLWVRFLKAGLTFVHTPDILSTVLWERGTKTSTVNRTRMREIRRLTASSHSAFVTAKTLIGFYMHHYSEYSRLAPLARPLIRLVRGRHAQHNRKWREDDIPDLITHIPVHHFNANPVSRVRISFSQPVTCRMKLRGPSVELERESDCNMPTNLPMGETGLLKIAAKGIDANQIRYIRLLD